MPNGIDQLYRTAIEKLAKSADADIEHLRRAVIRGDGVPLEPDPHLLAEASGKGVNRRSIGTPYRRAKGTPLLRCWVVDAGRGFRAAGGVGRA